MQQLIRFAGMAIAGDQVSTPVGVLTRRHATWTTGDPVLVRATPTWATVTAILLSPCTLGASLLLLLVKDIDPSGKQTFVLTVSDGRIEYTTVVACANQAEYHMYARMINDLRYPGPQPLPAIGAA